ncbi:hypothetical protein RB596_004136 [Gaeumannomyces avenae]
MPSQLPLPPSGQPARALSRATPADAVAIAAAEYTCFDDYIREVFMGLRSEADVPLLAARYARTMREGPHDVWIKVVDAESGTLAAASNWEVYPSRMPDDAGDTTPDYLVDEAARARSKLVMDGVNSARRRAMGPRGRVRRLPISALSRFPVVFHQSRLSFPRPNHATATNEHTSPAPVPFVIHDPQHRLWSSLEPLFAYRTYANRPGMRCLTRSGVALPGAMWFRKLPALPFSQTDLHICFTVAEHRRRGAAALMMRWGCGLADQLAAPGYVEASPDGTALYKSFGFYEIERTNAGELNAVNMKRDAVAVAAAARA